MGADLLSFIIFLPAIVALILMVTSKDVETIRNISFVTTLVVLFLVLKLYIDFDPHGGMQFVVDVPWIRSYGIHYYIGLDGFSLTVLMMIAILIPTAYHFLWEGRTKLYWVNMLLVQAGITGTLLSLDVILFYFFWEVMLLPIFIMIGMFGTGDRIFTTMKVTIYTMAGSLLMLVAIIYLGVSYFNEFHHWSFRYNDLMEITTLSHTESILLFFAFVIALGIKTPLFPLHTWIMETYKNAPTGAVFLLSAIMAKLGIYAIVRFMIPIFPEIYKELSFWFVLMGLFGLIYFGIAALKQDDIKRMLAYSSASHLNLMAAGIFSLNAYSVNGALYLMIAHSIATGGLFLLVGILQHETGTKSIKALGGIAQQAPLFTFVFAILLFANIALPGTNGFVGEFLVILGVYKYDPLMGYISGFTVIIAAAYMLWMFQRAMLQTESVARPAMRDLKIKEIIGVIPWIVLIFVMGLYPDIFIDKFEPSVHHFLYDILNLGVK